MYKGMKRILSYPVLLSLNLSYIRVHVVIIGILSKLIQSQLRTEIDKRGDTVQSALTYRRLILGSGGLGLVWDRLADVLLQKPQSLLTFFLGDIRGG